MPHVTSPVFKHFDPNPEAGSNLLSSMVTAAFRDEVIRAEIREERNIEYKCFDCSLLNRLGPKCPLSTLDCDECMKGYEDVPVTYEARRHRKVCEKSEPEKPNAGCGLNCAPGSYCFLGEFCTPCLDCRAYLRQQTVVCATKIEDCGSCLPGSAQIGGSLNSTSKPCEEQLATSSPHSREETESRIYMTGLIILGCTIVCTGGFIVYFVYSYVRHRASSNVPEETPVEAPPPYTPQVPEYSQQSDLVCGFFKEKPDEECNAIAFRLPTYNVTLSAPGPVAPPPEPMSYDDEETVDSPWRPYEENTANIGNNFLGRLPGTSTDRTRQSVDNSTNV